MPDCAIMPLFHQGRIARKERFLLWLTRRPADEATHVLDGIALALGQRGIFGHRFPGSGRGGELVQKLAPEHLFVLPLRRFSAPANGDQEGYAAEN